MSKIGFYDSAEWRRVRIEAIRHCRGLCQICLSNGRHVRAVIVHHVWHLDEFPQYGLCEFVQDPETGELTRNLLPVCRTCHETVCHPERMGNSTAPTPPLTPERW